MPMNVKGDEGLEIDALLTGDLTIRRWLDHRLETLVVIVIVIVIVTVFVGVHYFGPLQHSSAALVCDCNPNSQSSRRRATGRMDSVPFSN